MKALFLSSCLALVFVGCSKNEVDTQRITDNDNKTVSYKFVNQVNSEAITIIEHDKNNEIKNICTVNYGEISKDIKGTEQKGNVYTIAFRTSAKEYPNNSYFETVDVFTAGKSVFSFVLKKNENSKYITETTN
jgi:hypothetical protein